ncbi:uncharacterized protein [Zea mays]|uniref:uncharacterized protein n=1 Tax=Zea mays TaxID=4577 RepID=UPI0016524B45|nr:uncharacterized protein LOC118476330 [Zea mays]
MAELAPDVASCSLAQQARRALNSLAAAFSPTPSPRRAHPLCSPARRLPLLARARPSSLATAPCRGPSTVECSFSMRSASVWCLSLPNCGHNWSSSACSAAELAIVSLLASCSWACCSWPVKSLLCSELALLPGLPPLPQVRPCSPWSRQRRPWPAPNPADEFLPQRRLFASHLLLLPGRQSRPATVRFPWPRFSVHSPAQRPSVCSINNPAGLPRRGFSLMRARPVSRPRSPALLSVARVSFQRRKAPCACICSWPWWCCGVATSCASRQPSWPQSSPRHRIRPAATSPCSMPRSPPWPLPSPSP